MSATTGPTRLPAVVWRGDLIKASRKVGSIPDDKKLIKEARNLTKTPTFDSLTHAAEKNPDEDTASKYHAPLLIKL